MDGATVDLVALSGIAHWLAMGFRLSLVNDGDLISCGHGGRVRLGFGIWGFTFRARLDLVQSRFLLATAGLIRRYGQPEGVGCQEAGEQGRSLC